MNWDLTPTEAIQLQRELKKKINLGALNKPIHLPLPKDPERPTLYTLSNIAFPLRWIDRKGDWTADDLKRMELDEAEGTAWWFQHGPGSLKRRE